MTPAARRRFALAAITLGAYAACADQPAEPAQPYHDGPKRQEVAAPEIPVGWTVTTTTARPARASRSQRGPRSNIAPPRVVGDDFWHRLAMCESGGRLNPPGRYVGAFQFSRDTAAKVGIDGSEDYETQRAAAQRWAGMVDPGSTAGWPVCWWKAGGR